MYNRNNNNYNSKIEVRNPDGMVQTYTPDDGIERNDVMDATMIHNLQVGYFIDAIGTDLHVGIQNVFDEEPPYLNKGVSSTDDNLYSFRGRFFYMGVKKEF